MPSQEPENSQEVHPTEAIARAYLTENYGVGDSSLTPLFQGHETRHAPQYTTFPTWFGDRRISVQRGGTEDNPKWITEVTLGGR